MKCDSKRRTTCAAAELSNSQQARRQICGYSARNLMMGPRTSCSLLEFVGFGQDVCNIVSF
jgi:hypothetical protein